MEMDEFSLVPIDDHAMVMGLGPLNLKIKTS
jgi:hypothetical protein